MCRKIEKTHEEVNLLALDTSTNVASVAVFRGEKLVSEMILDHSLTHSKTLLPNLKKALVDAGLTFKDLDVIACVIGPGSFTGIRIGLATAKGLCQALDIPMIPVSSLYALAYNIPYVNGLICPIIDARRNQVYTNLYKSDGRGNIEEIKKDFPLDLEKLEDWLNEQTELVYLLGDGVVKYTKDMKFNPNIIKVRPYLATSKASSVGAYALDHLDQSHDYHDIEPIYLRPSYAEEKKK